MADKQPLLDSGILRCHIHILKAFLDYDKDDKMKSATEADELTENVADDDIAQVRQIEVFCCILIFFWYDTTYQSHHKIELWCSSHGIISYALVIWIIMLRIPIYLTHTISPTVLFTSISCKWGFINSLLFFKQTIRGIIAYLGSWIWWNLWRIMIIDS